MNHNPFTLAKQSKPYVAAFLAEVSTNKPERFRVVPSRYLCLLFNQMCDLRGGFFKDAKMNQQRLSFVLSSMGYEKTRKTRSGITCFNVGLLEEPAPPTTSVADSLGAACVDVFKYTPTAEIPATILNEIIAIRHTVDLMERNRLAEDNRWTEEEKTTPPHAVLHPAKSSEVIASSADAGEPDFQQMEANDAQADAESLTENNDYDS